MSDTEIALELRADEALLLSASCEPSRSVASALDRVARSRSTGHVVIARPELERIGLDLARAGSTHADDARLERIGALCARIAVALARAAKVRRPVGDDDGRCGLGPWSLR